MNLLQYAYEFKDDFDMTSIRERIAAKRQLLDDLPGLCWKAWLLSEPSAGLTQPKSYAPLYLFNSVHPLVDFMEGPIYKGVTDAFGWTLPFQGPWINPQPFSLLEAKACSLCISHLTTHADLVAALADPLLEVATQIAHVRMLDVSRMRVCTYTFWSVSPEAVQQANAKLVYDVIAVSPPASLLTCQAPALSL